jgi:alpha-beta hydrolase superfamily lysophospholipase
MQKKQFQTASYLDAPDGKQIYCVHRRPVGESIGSVLVCGPASAERKWAYQTLVDWSHALVQHDYQALTFDYAGTGESSGHFEDMTFSRWQDDISLCAEHLRKVAPIGPLVLHGTRVGALLAAELFSQGVGDALLLWQPPESGRAILWEMLRQSSAHAMLVPGAGRPQTRQQAVASLQAGKLVDVDGYPWSLRLWNSAQDYKLVSAVSDARRPCHAIHIRRVGAPDVAALRGSSAEVVEAANFWTISVLLKPRCEALFERSLAWLSTAISRIAHAA